MKELDLQELDRLERGAAKATRLYDVQIRTLLDVAAREQLRPLLNLVDDLDDKLEDAATALHGERAHEGRFWDCQRLGCSSAIVTIDTYRRAKGK